MKRKFGAVILTVVFVLISMVACGQSEAEEAETAPVLASDVEILSKENHPQWMDNIDDAYSTWEDEIEAEKVFLIGKYDDVYGDEYILEIGISPFEEEGVDSYLYDIAFHFENVDEKITLDEGLDIIKSYLPQDMIEQYYEETMSYYEVDEGDYPEIRYFKNFKAKAEYEDEVYDDDFFVFIHTDLDGYVTWATINVVVNIATDEYCVPWDYDFFE